MLFDGYKPFPADLLHGRDVGQEKPSESVNDVLGGEGFARNLCKGQRESSS